MKKGKGKGSPEHVALIPDGNRRWAKKNGFNILSSYRRGIDRFQDFMHWSKEFGVKTVTVWALSTENFTNRTTAELKVLFYLYTKAAKDKKLIELLKKEGAHVRIIGNVGVLPKKLRDALHSLEHQTMQYKDLTLNILINYGGRDDLTYALNQIKKESARRNRPIAITEKAVREHLRTANVPDVDLVVRTSGEMRLSGLLPWQSAYSELYFADKFWPDFEKRDYKKAIETYSRRTRRYGK